MSKQIFFSNPYLLSMTSIANMSSHPQRQTRPEQQEKKTRGRPRKEDLGISSLFKMQTRPTRGRPKKQLTEIQKLQQRSSVILAELRDIRKKKKQKGLNKTVKNYLVYLINELKQERKDILNKIQNIPIEQEEVIQQRLSQQEERYTEQQRQERERLLLKKLYLRFIPPKDPVKHDDVIPDSINKVRSKYSNDNKRQDKFNTLIHECFFNKIVEYNDIIDNLWKVFYDQTHSFKINISFGYVFEQQIEEKKEICILVIINIIILLVMVIMTSLY